MKGFGIMVYWLGMVAESVIRMPYNKARSKAKLPAASTTLEKLLLNLLLVGMGLLPLLFSVTSWLSFADYELGAVWSGVGAGLMLLAVLIFWRSHADLGMNWSPTLEIQTEHTLVSGGVYGWVRHPMYTSQLVWCLAQPLLLQNWLAGGLDVVVFLVFFFYRAGAEEKMMEEHFGLRYREYMGKTKRLIPWVW